VSRKLPCDSAFPAMFRCAEYAWCYRLASSLSHTSELASHFHASPICRFHIAVYFEPYEKSFPLVDSLCVSTIVIIFATFGHIRQHRLQGNRIIKLEPERGLWHSKGTRQAKNLVHGAVYNAIRDLSKPD